LRLPRILSDVPRERRAILDADGMFNRRLWLDDYDRNHTDDAQREQWLEHYGILADRVFQPTWAPREPGARPLPFYGYNPSALTRPESAPEKVYDILCVGHNWWRWREVSTRLLPALEKIRPQVGGICFMGSWWDEPPVVDSSLAPAFQSDRQWFARLNIGVQPAVPYTDVIGAMSASRINLMLQRPLLRELRLLTSKYFEIFQADTVPLVMLHPDHAEAIYGPAGRELALYEGVDQKLLDVLHHPAKYEGIVSSVREHLMKHHSYPVRVRQLVEALAN
jgi:hypothetical protein